jgi:hypothetical protein
MYCVILTSLLSLQAFAGLLDKLGLNATQLLGDRALLLRVLQYHVSPSVLPSSRLLRVFSFPTLLQRSSLRVVVGCVPHPTLAAVHLSTHPQPSGCLTNDGASFSWQDMRKQLLHACAQMSTQVVCVKGR